LAPAIRSAAMSATCEKLTRSRSVSLSDHIQLAPAVQHLL
jgi:hypothetical protein